MEKLSKKQTQMLYERCLRLVRRKPPQFFLFRRMRSCQGICDYESETLQFDHRKEFIRTAYHECIHYLCPDWCETQVLYAESRVINTVSILDTARFLKYISIKLYKLELQKSLIEKWERKKYKKRKQRTKKIIKKNL